MQIQVKLYASLRRFNPEGLAGVPMELELNEDATLQDVAEELKIPSDEVKVMFVNGVVREMDWPLKPGDKVGIFPPVGGG